MIKTLIFFVAVLCISTTTFSQETYYSDVNLNLTGVTLKEELATKIKDEIKLEDYFKKLANNGVLTYDQTIGNEMYYKKEGQHTGSISVNTDKNIWTV